MKKNKATGSAGLMLLAAFFAGCGSNPPSGLDPRSDSASAVPEYSASPTIASPIQNTRLNPEPTDTPIPDPTVTKTSEPEDESDWGVISLAAGGDHTCAVFGDLIFREGDIQCWGRNDFGQLGDDFTTDSNRPVDLYWGGAAGLFHGVTAGWGHSCGFGDFLDEPAGGVYCWGYNQNGELGDGTNIHSYMNEYKVRVWGLYDVVAMAAGDDHTCALLGNGSVKCWGLNDSGQLGDRTANASNTPVEVKYLVGGVVAIAAGWGHTCALIQDGGVRCWGDNQYGQLGDGTTIPYRAERGIVAGLPNDIIAIAAGGAHTCALRKTSQVLCWGQNNYGQLGDGTSTDKYLPVYANAITRIDDEVLQLAVGRYHTCALMNGGRVRCWGHNQFGQLGDGTNLTGITAGDVDIGGEKISIIAAGWGHTCAGTDNGEILCWGKNEYGQLGNGTNADSSTPVKVAGLDE